MVNEGFKILEEVRAHMLLRAMFRGIRVRERVGATPTDQGWIHTRPRVAELVLACLRFNRFVSPGPVQFGYVDADSG